MNTDISILNDGEWITLGEIISSNTNTEVDTYSCVGSGDFHLPRQTTTKIEIVLKPDSRVNLRNDPRQKFRALGIEIDAMITHQDLSFGGYGVGLTMEWIVLNSKDLVEEVALGDCLDTMEYNEELL